MSSIIKVDTIQDQDGNNIINESGNVITIGASGDTITVPAGATVSGFTSAGIDDNATSVAITIDSSERVAIGTTTTTAGILTLDNTGQTSETLLTTEDTGGSGAHSHITLKNTTGTVASLLTTSDNLEFRVDDATVFANISGSEHMRITSDGKVGIGTSAPEQPLHIQSNSGVRVERFAAASGSANLDLRKSRNATIGSHTILQNGDNIGGIVFRGSDGTQFENAAGIFAQVDGTPGTDDMPGRLTFSTTADGTNSYTERMRIDSSGNVLVGKTASNTATAGIELRATNQVTITRSSNTPLIINRLSNDGTITKFQKDGTNIGSIGNNGDNLVIDCVSTDHTGLDFANDKLIPRKNSSASDNGVDLGYSGGRFKDIYLGGGAFIGGTGTANKLSDYEEGTWTPKLGNETTAVYSNQTGWYRKIGETVFIYFSLSLSSKGDISGSYTKIANLPFNGSPTIRFGSGQIHAYRLGSSAHIQGIEFGGSVPSVGWIMTGGGSTTGYLNTSFVADNTYFEGFAMYRTG